MSGWLIITYDVVKNRRRTRLHKRLRRLIPRVQKSVFEGPADDAELGEVRDAITEEIDRRTDTVRVFHLCSRCRARTELFGTAGLVPAEAEDVIIDVD